MADFNFELVSPERVLMSESIEHVVLPGSEGQLGVLAGHVPTIVKLQPGMINIISGTSVVRKIYIRGGFADINAQDVTVLAEHAVDIETAESDAISAELAIAEKSLAEAQTDDERYIARLSVDTLQSL